MSFSLKLRMTTQEFLTLPYLFLLSSTGTGTELAGDVIG
jgi:hypothetical protein